MLLRKHVVLRYRLHGGRVGDYSALLELAKRRRGGRHLAATAARAFNLLTNLLNASGPSTRVTGSVSPLNRAIIPPACPRAPLRPTAPARSDTLYWIPF
ncbi:hypothetical protein EVAR_56227_1 [Eumeta japonica]|uniref:Uncharacterized protein n=1 Tax=Eumeta variegata TaxID=151549 RepID=A0A4C1XK77_EUMVA|nr:hypothetical protein EVAR_56227_1 [Eumeta japonica]